MNTIRNNENIIYFLKEIKIRRGELKIKEILTSLEERDIGKDTERGDEGKVGEKLQLAMLLMELWFKLKRKLGFNSIMELIGVHGANKVPIMKGNGTS